MDILSFPVVPDMSTEQCRCCVSPCPAVVCCGCCDDSDMEVSHVPASCSSLLCLLLLLLYRCFCSCTWLVFVTVAVLQPVFHCYTLHRLCIASPCVVIACLLAFKRPSNPPTWKRPSMTSPPLPVTRGNEVRPIIGSGGRFCRSVTLAQPRSSPHYVSCYVLNHLPSVVC